MPEIKKEEELFQEVITLVKDGQQKAQKDIDEYGKITSETKVQLENMSKSLEGKMTEQEAKVAEFKKEQEKLKEELNAKIDEMMKGQGGIEKMIVELKHPGNLSLNNTAAEKKSMFEQFFREMRIRGGSAAVNTGMPDSDQIKSYIEAMVNQREENQAAYEKFVKEQEAYLIKGSALPFQLTKEQKAVYTTGSYGGAGALVMQMELITDILDTEVQEMSPMMSLATVENTAMPGQRFPVQTGHASASRTYEQGTRTVDENVAFAERFITLYEMYVMYKIHHKLLADVAYDLPGKFREEVATAFSVKIGTETMTGTGIGEMNGILTAAAAGTISSVNTGISASIEDPRKYMTMLFQFKEKFQNNITFQTRRSSMPTWLGLMDGMGQLYANASMVMNFDVATKRFTILGMPVYMNPDIPAFGADAYVAVVGDMKRAYKIVNRTSGRRVIEDPFTHKATGFVEFLTYLENGGDYVDTQAVKVFKAAA